MLLMGSLVVKYSVDVDLILVVCLGPCLVSVVAFCFVLFDILQFYSD